MEYVSDPSRPLIAHENNPFLQRKTPLREKVVHIVSILGVGIISVLLFYVLFVRGGTKVAQLALNPRPLPTGTTTSQGVYLDTSTSTQTQTWKTYINAKLALSLRYPSDWTVSESGEQIFAHFYPVNFPSPDQTYVIYLFYWDNPKEESLEELEKDTVGAVGFSPGIYSPKNKKITLASGIQAYEEKQCVIDGPAVPCRSYIIPHGKYVIKISSTDRNVTNQEAIFETMANSLSFSQ